MTWIRFAFWLLGIYTIYFTALISFDYLHENRGEPENDTPELTFVEDIAPVKTPVEEITGFAKGSPVTSSGGVSLKELFNLAREESVEFIKSVSF